MTTRTITASELTPRHIGRVVAFQTTGDGTGMSGLSVIAGRLAWLARPAQSPSGQAATTVCFEHVPGRYAVDDTTEVTIYEEEP